MTTTTSPGPGLIGLTPIAGRVGKLIEVGQFLNGNGFAPWEHAFITLGNGLIVEAEPGGARVAHLAEYSDIYWCENIAKLAAPAQLQGIADAAKRYTQAGPWGSHGVPYSFLDYFALAQHRLHIPGPGLENYIKTTRHMICSQLCDQAYTDMHVNLFAGRWQGDVTPMDLFDLDVKLAKS